MLTVSRCSHKSLATKKILAVNRRRNRTLPNWIRNRTDNTIRYNSKRKHWRRTKLGI
jgi:large subunit ribosomal protein L39e